MDTKKSNNNNSTVRREKAYKTKTNNNEKYVHRHVYTCEFFSALDGIAITQKVSYADGVARAREQPQSNANSESGKEQENVVIYII